MKYRADIQGLRAVAFIMVFLFHINKDWLPGGFIGVDIFFVISGYLITSIIIKQRENDEFSFLSFYEKRIRRIVPALYVLIFSVLIYGAYQYLHSDMHLLRKWTFSSALFFSNIIFAKGGDYFGAGASENPLLHTWSLAIEMQFYLFLPLLIIFINRKYQFYILIFIVIISCFYSTYFLYIDDNKIEVYFSLIARASEFLIGSLLVFISFKTSERVIVSNFLSLIGLIIIALCSYFYSELMLFPGISAILPCVGVSMIILASSSGVINKFLGTPVLEYIGKLSYSLYLWHWPIMAFIRYNNSKLDFSTTEYFAIITLTVFLGMLSYYFVERIFLHISNKLYFSILVPYSILIVGISFYLVQITSSKLTPEIEKYAYPSFGYESHGKPYFQHLGDKERNSSFILLGDSHALALKSTFDFLGKQLGFSIDCISSDTYPPIHGLVRDDIKNDKINPNGYLNYQISQDIAEYAKQKLDSSSVIFIVSTNFDRIPSLAKSVEELGKNLRSDQKLVIINSFPKLDLNPVRINKGVVKNKDVEFVYKFTTLPERLRNLVNNHHNINIYDFSRSSVFEKQPFYRDTVLYYDEAHLNSLGGRVLGESVLKDFKEFYSKNLLTSESR